MADPLVSLTPVDHDPFAPPQSTTDRAAGPLVTLQPVEHDPFFSADTKDPYATAPHEVLTPGQRAGWQDAWQTFGAPVVSAVTAPGDILAGKLTPQDPRFVDSAIGLGAMVSAGPLASGEGSAARMGWEPPAGHKIEVSGEYRGKPRTLGTFNSIDEAEHAVLQLPGVMRTGRDLDEAPDAGGYFGRLDATGHHSIDFESDPQFKHYTDDMIDAVPNMKWSSEFYLRHVRGAK